LPDRFLKFWELNFVQHRYWVGSLHKEAEELSSGCLEHPLNTSLYCLHIVVKTLDSLAGEIGLNICPELTSAHLLKSRLCVGYEPYINDFIWGLVHIVLAHLLQLQP
jgi:hypothetical protein